MNLFNNIYRGKKILITGHTGFKGSWLSIWLHELGANVIGYALEPYSPNDNFVLSRIGEKIIDIRGDIRDQERLSRVFSDFKPEIVFHMAAQPLVKLSYDRPFETYEINVMGTVNVLEAIRVCQQTKIGVMVTTDKCYQDNENFWGYKESDPMGGHDPYASSKAAAEIAINSWRLSFMNPENFGSHGKAIASARAGNVIGGGDWAENRIVPDCIRAIEKNEAIIIRNPGAVRPWQFVLEALSGYLLLGQKLYENPTQYCESWNFGPYFESMVNVRRIAEMIISIYGKGEINSLSVVDDQHESEILNLDISKAFFKLGWKPSQNIQQKIELTVDWYKKYQSDNVYELCVEQIEKFYMG